MQTHALPKLYKMQTNLVCQSYRQGLSAVDKCCLSWTWRCCSEPAVLSVSSAARNRIHRCTSAAATHATRHARLCVLGVRRHVGWRDCVVAGVCDAGASRACLLVASVCTLGQRRACTTCAVVVSTERVCTTRAKPAVAGGVRVVELPWHVGDVVANRARLRAAAFCVSGERRACTVFAAVAWCERMCAMPAKPVAASENMRARASSSTQHVAA